MLDVYLIVVRNYSLAGKINITSRRPFELHICLEDLGTREVHINNLTRVWSLVQHRYLHIQTEVGILIRCGGALDQWTNYDVFPAFEQPHDNLYDRIDVIRAGDSVYVHHRTVGLWKDNTAY